MTAPTPTRPRVALASHRLADPLTLRTGLGRYQHRLAEALVALDDVDVVLVAPREPGPDPAWAPAPVVRVRGPRPVVQGLWTLSGRPRLERLLPGGPGLDLVHVVDATIAARTRAPLVHTVHDLFPLLHPAWEGRRGRALFAGVARAVRSAERVITPTTAVADQVTRHLGVPAAHVAVVPEGVDDRFRTAHPVVPDDLAGQGVQADSYWLALGRPGPRKNLGLLVDALADAGSSTPLVVAGPPGPASADLRARGAARGVTVHLVGFVPDSALPGLVAGARALLHPALDEGFGLPPLEAMAAGVPVVTTPSRAVREVVGDVAALCPADDVTAWADTVRRLDDDDTERAERGRAGRDRAARFTWDATARATVEVYAACLR